MARFTTSGTKRKLSPSQKRANYLARQERDFIAQLISLRKKSGLTQTQVAEKLGVSQQAISKFESLESSPSLSTVITYAHAIEALVHFEAALDDGRFETLGENWITTTIHSTNKSPEDETSEDFANITPEHFIDTPKAEVVAGALRSDFALAARKQSPTDALTTIQREWVSKVAQKASTTIHSFNAYDAQKLSEIAETISQEVCEPEKFSGLQSKLAEAGVSLVYVERTKSSKISGVSFYIDETPVIGLSGHGKRLDKVLFTLLHEISHILNEDVSADSQVILHDGKKPSTVQDQEDAADELASSLLFQGRKIQLPPNQPSKIWVEQQAQELKVHPIVVIGHLQNAQVISWRSHLATGAPQVTEYLEQWD